MLSKETHVLSKHGDDPCRRGLMGFLVIKIGLVGQITVILIWNTDTIVPWGNLVLLVYVFCGIGTLSEPVSCSSTVAATLARPWIYA
jgi:hypothetical protein